MDALNGHVWGLPGETIRGDGELVMIGGVAGLGNSESLWNH